MRSDRPASKANGESGFILIVVLWVLAALAALASTYLVYVDNAAFATQLNDDRLRIRNAISTGIELTAYKLLAAPKDKDKDKDKDVSPAAGRFHASVVAVNDQRDLCIGKRACRSQCRAQGSPRRPFHRRRRKPLQCGDLRGPHRRLAHESGRRSQKSRSTTPVKTTPVKTTPAKTTPVKKAPAKTTPIKTTPVKTTPAKTTPVKTTAAKTKKPRPTKKPAMPTRLGRRRFKMFSNCRLCSASPPISSSAFCRW